jgi:Spy/CpxP family protein refolding chaperone
VKALKSIKMDFLIDKLNTEATIKIAQLEFRGLMEEDEADLKEIEAKLKSVEKLRTNLKLSHIKAFREGKALLTPEQKEKIGKRHEM